jgi:uncharacterized protein (TIGR02147 family)
MGLGIEDVPAVMKAAPRPDILSATCYRRFLAEYYVHRKSLRGGFSYRMFASRCGIKSPNYLQLVIQGKRNLSDHMAVFTAKAMHLSAPEQRTFCALVKRSNAQDEASQEQARREWLIAIKQMVTKQIPKAQSDILGGWYYLLVRELVFLPDFELSGAWVSARLGGLISEKQGEEAIAKLIAAGFIKQNSIGQWTATDSIIDTGSEGYDELKVTQVHKDTLKMWSQNLNRFNSQHREMGLINIPISRDKIPEFKTRLRQFQEEIIGWLQDEKNPEEIVQLGLYLMPLTHNKA